MPSSTSDDSGDGGAGTAQVVAAAITIFIAIVVPVSIYVSILVPHWFPCWYDRQQKWLGNEEASASSVDLLAAPAPAPAKAEDGPRLVLSETSGPAGKAGGGEGADPRSRTAPPPATLTFRDVTYAVPRRGGLEDLLILKGVSGVLPAGSLTSIMGPSGCGKSTLLDVLADCKGSGAISGDIRLNGLPRPPNFRTVASYVMQSDSTHTMLTVRETLNFAAELRLPGSIPRPARLARVHETLMDTDLLHVADTRVGDDVSGGLSGGQRRRVTVAIELINRPQLLFLDEPTSGLDAYGALQVVGALRRFADRGQTIACTIHQPRADIFKLFDQLLLMSAGETMYFGPIAGIYPYFSDAGLPCDPGVNPADFIVDLTHSPEADESEESGLAFPASPASPVIPGGGAHPPSVAQLVSLFAQSALHAKMLTDLRKVHRTALADTESSAAPETANAHGRYANSNWRQVRVLVRRMYVVDRRNAAYMIAWPLNCFVLLLQGLTYIVIVQPPASQPLAHYRDAFAAQQTCNLAPDGSAMAAELNSDVIACGEALTTKSGVDYAHAALLFMVLNALFVNELMYVPMISQEKAIFAREHGANAYSAVAWHAAWLTKMLLSAACKMVFYPPAYYFPAQLRLSSTSYLVAAFLTGGMGFGGSATAMLVASAIPSYSAANTTFTFLSIVYQNLCGFYLSLDVIPPWISWLSYFSIYRYAFGAFAVTQVAALTVFADSRSVYVVFGLSAMTYVWGFFYHACALGCTVLYHKKRATFVPTTADDAEHDPPLEVGQVEVGLSSPATATPAAAPSPTATLTPAATPASALSVCTPSDGASAGGPTSTAGVPSPQSRGGQTPSRLRFATPASRQSRAASSPASAPASGSSIEHAMRTRVSRLLHAAVEMSELEARDPSMRGDRLSRWSNTYKL